MKELKQNIFLPVKLQGGDYPLLLGHQLLLTLSQSDKVEVDWNRNQDKCGWVLVWDKPVSSDCKHKILTEKKQYMKK